MESNPQGARSLAEGIDFAALCRNVAEKQQSPVSAQKIVAVLSAQYKKAFPKTLDPDGRIPDRSHAEICHIASVVSSGIKYSPSSLSGESDAKSDLFECALAVARKHREPNRQKLVTDVCAELKRLFRERFPATDHLPSEIYDQVRAEVKTFCQDGSEKAKHSKTRKFDHLTLVREISLNLSQRNPDLLLERSVTAFRTQQCQNQSKIPKADYGHLKSAVMLVSKESFHETERSCVGETFTAHVPASCDT